MRILILEDVSPGGQVAHNFCMHYFNLSMHSDLYIPSFYVNMNNLHNNTLVNYKY